MTTAIDRLHAAAHRPGTAHLRDLAIGIGPIALCDALEILARVAAMCSDHETCGECGATFCETCGIGEAGYCGHGFPRCRDHWPAPECTDCADILREQAEYDQRDKPWGAPA